MNVSSLDSATISPKIACRNRMGMSGTTWIGMNRVGGCFSWSDALCRIRYVIFLDLCILRANANVSFGFVRSATVAGARSYLIRNWRPCLFVFNPHLTWLFPLDVNKLEYSRAGTIMPRVFCWKILEHPVRVRKLRRVQQSNQTNRSWVVVPHTFGSRYGSRT